MTEASLAAPATSRSVSGRGVLAAFRWSIVTVGVVGLLLVTRLLGESGPLPGRVKQAIVRLAPSISLDFAIWTVVATAAASAATGYFVVWRGEHAAREGMRNASSMARGVAAMLAFEAATAVVGLLAFAILLIDQ